ncbi:MAG: immunoglobulin domain-containing protein [Phycisphaerales bacterium]|nr:immunoglobulin domain-containing protein [Phycisphaerales bacterium]
MRSVPRTLTVLAMLAGAAASAHAQTMIASSPTSGTNVDLFIVDPNSGAHLPYMSVTVPAGREMRFLAALPDNTLAASLYVDGTANSASLYMKINPTTGTSATMAYGTPLNTSYAEGIEYSPRHNALLVSFGAFGNFGTNRLALVNPLNGAVLSTTGALAGISDLDYIASSATQDLFFDLNATSAPRVKNLTTLLPNPAFGAFASPPAKANWFDAAINPANGDVWFIDGDGRRLIKLVGNSYVNGPLLADNFQARGLAFGFLPARALAQQYAGICPGGSTTINVYGVGTDPFTYKWYKNGNPIDTNLNPTAATFSLLLSNAGAQDEGNYSCVVTNAYGSFTTPNIPFALCRADFNCDAAVDDADFTGFLVGYNILDCADPAMPVGCPADLNLDGAVDDADFTLFAQAYNRLLCSF